uniref:SFRICE_006108 n=1 Tax=Spodoptera frugiperda TaxID=7108 RepID=A0A2H1W8E0_SPOFR
MAPRTAKLRWRIFIVHITPTATQLSTRSTEDYRTCKFSQDFDLEMSFMQIFCSSSLAMLSDINFILITFEYGSIFCEYITCFPVFLACFLSLLSFSRICLRMPTSSSSTLCWIPDDVSMNLQSLDVASALPSKFLRTEESVQKYAINKKLKSTIALVDTDSAKLYFLCEKMPAMDVCNGWLPYYRNYRKI